MSCDVYYYHEPDVLDLKIKERGSWVFTLTIRRADGTPFDLTGYTAHADFVRSDTEVGLTPVLIISTTAVITSALGGVVTLSLTKAQCESLNASVGMLWDLFCDNAGTGDARCFIQGAVNIIQRYTAP